MPTSFAVRPPALSGTSGAGEVLVPATAAITGAERVTVLGQNESFDARSSGGQLT